jgi:transposase-like protein
MIARWAACGMSTREVSRVLEDIFGALVSPGTVSRVVAALDAQIHAFHGRPLDRGWR